MASYDDEVVFEYDSDVEADEGSDASEAGFEYEDEEMPAAASAPQLARAASADELEVLDAEGLRSSMAAEIDRAVETLGVSFSVACTLLRHFHWDFTRLAEAFCDRTASVCTGFKPLILSIICVAGI